MYTQLISCKDNPKSWLFSVQKALLLFSCCLSFLYVSSSSASQNNKIEPHGSSFVVDHANLIQHRQYSEYSKHSSNRHERRHKPNHHFGSTNRYDHWRPQHLWKGKFWKNKFWRNHHQRRYRPYHQRHNRFRSNHFSNTLFTLPLLFGAEQIFQDQWGNESQYRDRQTQVQQSQAQQTQAKQVTTSMSYSKGATRLPDNARVIQVDGKTRYQWQGKTYRFDWQQQVYLPINESTQTQ